MRMSHFDMKNLIKIFLITIFFNISLFAAFTQQKVLSPDEAFQVSSSKTGKGIILKIKLGEKMYVYDNKLHVELISPKKALLDKETERPKPVSFHGFIVHRKDIKILIPNRVIKKYINSGKFKIKLSYQGCSEMGLCYQPMSKDFIFTSAKVLNTASSDKKDIVLPFASSKVFNNTTNAQNNIAAPLVSKKSLNKTTKVQNHSTLSLSEEDKISNTIKSNSIFMVLLMFFGFGLLLALTPCVLPMIPILSSIIVAQSNKGINTKRAFLLSLVYVLAMSLTYAVAGIIAGLFGANIQTAVQNPWVISTFSLIFVLLSLSMFGLYELQMPSFIQSKLSKSSQSSKGGFVGVAIMGFLSAIIVGPCVSAPLTGALIYIGQSGNALLGGSALFVMSLGMGVPLLMIGAGAGKYLPKPGKWMDNIKAIFGVLMLSVAAWEMSLIISPFASMLLWMVLILISSIYMGALEPLGKNVTGWKKLLKGIAVIFFIYSVMLFIGAMQGATNPLNPLASNNSNVTKITSQTKQQTVEKKSEFKIVKTLNELNKEIKNSKKPVMVDFWAQWCVSCKEFDEYTLKNPSVEKRLAKFRLIRIDVTKNDAKDKVLLRRFHVFGPPVIIFFKQKKELRTFRVVGLKDATFFAKQLDKVLAYQ